MLRGRPRYEPRNLDFADGLDRWDLDCWPGPAPDRPGAPEGASDYAAVADGPCALLSATAPRPAGSAALVQAVYADDYRGSTITVSGELSGELLSGQGGLRLEILRHWWRGPRPARTMAAPSPAAAPTGPAIRSRRESP